MTRAGWWLVAGLALVTSGCSEQAPAPPVATLPTPQPEAEPDPDDAAMRRAIDWLVKQQGAGGGWRSGTYGQMRGGVGNTALAVYAIACVPQRLREPDEAAVLRGIRYLAESLDKQGYVLGRDGQSDYPTYATSLILLAMDKLEIAGWPEERRRMTGYLLAAQQRERQGVSHEELDYGGWNHTGGDETDGRFAGETSLSVTSFALDALEREHALDDSARAAALTFLARCQNFDPEHRTGDGGFFFTPVANDPRNKAGSSDRADLPPRAHSYGSATADGIVALLACGVPADDPRVQAGLAWFTHKTRLDVSPGFGSDELSVRSREALQLYYQLAMARLIHRLPKSPVSTEASQIANALYNSQRPDGSWQNENPLMREDDPLIATGLALAAMALAETSRVEYPKLRLHPPQDQSP